MEGPMALFGKKNNKQEKTRRTGKMKEASRSKKENTRIVVRYNVGYDNHLFIRGNGPGLNWEHGVMLKNIGPDEWVWETTAHFKDCEFKVLINDQQFENGENHHIDDGGAVQYTPNF
jgi:hypothetical protein